MFLTENNDDLVRLRLWLRWFSWTTFDADLEEDSEGVSASRELQQVSLENNILSF